VEAGLHHLMADDGIAGKAFQQESVWDYPRPPRLESTSRHLRVVHAGIVVAETRGGARILETSHPPVYYFPPRDVAMQWLRPSARRGTFCEFKGVASYWDLVMTSTQGSVTPGMELCSAVAGLRRLKGLSGVLCRQSG
jgi:uncharacterized protein (DUF427 family)